MIPVPGRKIYAKVQSILPAGIRQLFEDIALPASPATLRHRVRAGPGWPEAKAVVVFGRDDNAFHAGVLRRSGPLSAVQFRGIEQVFRLRPTAPFGPAEGVGAKVNEHVIFHLLPTQLRFCGHRPVRLGLARERKQKQEYERADLHLHKDTAFFAEFT